MHTIRRWQLGCMVGLGLALAALAGCQTWTYDSGMTLPSGWYLQHPPQYIPPSPAYPYAREAASMEAAALGAPAPPGAGALPPPVGVPAPVGPGVPAPAPAPGQPLPPPGR